MEVSAKRIASRKPDYAFERPWLIAAAREASAVKRRDVESLVEIYESLPPHLETQAAHRSCIRVKAVWRRRAVHINLCRNILRHSSSSRPRPASHSDRDCASRRSDRRLGTSGLSHRAAHCGLRSSPLRRKAFAQPLTAARSLRGSVFRKRALTTGTARLISFSLS